MAGMAGFGPTNAGVKVPCLTAWRHPIALFIISQKIPYVNIFILFWIIKIIFNKSIAK